MTYGGGAEHSSRGISRFFKDKLTEPAKERPFLTVLFCQTSCCITRVPLSSSSSISLGLLLPPPGLLPNSYPTGIELLNVNLHFRWQGDFWFPLSVKKKKSINSMKKQTWVELRNVNVSPESLWWNGFWKLGTFWKTNWDARLGQISFCTWTKVLCTARRGSNSPKLLYELTCLSCQLSLIWNHAESEKDPFYSTVLNRI